MKKSLIYSLVVVCAIVSLVGCGGASGTDSTGSTDAVGAVDGSPTPTATGDNTKALSGAAMRAAKWALYGASEEAIYAAMNNTSTSQSKTAKASITETISDYRYSCFHSGAVYVNGSLTTTCTRSDDEWSCTDASGTMQFDFDDCEEATGVEGVSYWVFLDGTGNATMTGTAGKEDGSTTFNISGEATGEVTASGEAEGTATFDLDIDVTRLSPYESPEATCAGTVSVVNGESQEVCGLTSDCTSCSQ